MTSIVNDCMLFSLQQGEELPPYVKAPVTKVQLVQYAGASGDFNPLHTDDTFTQSIGMDGVIAHGMLVMGFLGEYVMQLAKTEAVVKNFSMRFGAMTVPGDTITCGGVVKHISEAVLTTITITVTATNQHGKVVGGGEALLQKVGVTN